MKPSLCYRVGAKRGERAPALYCVRINDELTDVCHVTPTSSVTDSRGGIMVVLLGA